MTRRKICSISDRAIKRKLFSKQFLSHDGIAELLHIMGKEIAHVLASLPIRTIVLSQLSYIHTHIFVLNLLKMKLSCIRY